MNIILYILTLSTSVLQYLQKTSTSVCELLCRVLVLHDESLRICIYSEAAIIHLQRNISTMFTMQDKMPKV